MFLFREQAKHLFKFCRIGTFITVLTKPPPPDPVINQANSVHTLSLQTTTVSFPAPSSTPHAYYSRPYDAAWHSV
jgi:hypothetical protein